MKTLFVKTSANKEITMASIIEKATILVVPPRQSHVHIHWFLSGR